ncbi:hypothetical protein [Nocardioides stalactiti]|uniref:hypothetical protein n=1 Tax=Nocardioides stalactiti TaxID=2755356 RepID=UPI00160410C7|nr:hypothetical protein [Nocardioides stalactiti]
MADTVSYTSCDRELDYVPYGASTQWRPTLTIDTPQVVPVRSNQTVAFSLSDLPADTFPGDVADATLSLTLTFEDGRGNTFGLTGERFVGTFDADAPLDLGSDTPFEFHEFQYADSGWYDFRPKQVEIGLLGDPQGSGSGFFSTYVCDQAVAPEPILQVAAYDPDADARLETRATTVRQGEGFDLRGYDFAAETLEDPDADIELRLGGLALAGVDADATGAFSEPVVVPEFAKPGGSVVLRGIDQTDQAQLTLRVVARKGVASVAPRAVATGRSATVRGSAFKPGERVRITLKTRRGAGVRVFRVQATVGPDGTFSKRVRLARAAKGGWKVDVAGPESYRKATASFRIR